MALACGVLALGCGSDPSTPEAPAPSSPAAASAEMEGAAPLARGTLSPVRFVRRAPSPDFAPALGADAGVTIRASEGLSFVVTDVTSDRVEALAAVDASAPLGGAAVEIVQGDTTYAVSGDLAVIDAEPARFAAESTTLEFDDARASQLLWLDPASAHAFVTVETSAPDAGLILLDSEGKFPRELTLHAGTIRTVIAGPRALVVARPREGGSLTLTLHRRSVRAAGDAKPGAVVSEAGVLGPPDVYVERATLVEGEAHYYAVDIASGAIGQRLQIETLAGDPATDTRLTVLRDDRVAVLGAPSDDLDAHDRLTSEALPAPGRYFVRVEPGSAFDPAHADYGLVVMFQ